MHIQLHFAKKTLENFKIFTLVSVILCKNNDFCVSTDAPKKLPPSGKNALYDATKHVNFTKNRVIQEYPPNNRQETAKK